MTHLIDSDWVADWLKGHRAAVTLLRRLPADGLAISIVTYAEIYEGVYFGRDPARHEADFRNSCAG
ncbi:MAG: hypothetical protein U0531_07410 [Dehalococcoidia bacterium]